jgi:hypothetical protein
MKLKWDHSHQRHINITKHRYIVQPNKHQNLIQISLTPVKNFAVMQKFSRCLLPNIPISTEYLRKPESNWEMTGNEGYRHFRSNYISPNTQQDFAESSKSSHMLQIPWTLLESQLKLRPKFRNRNVFHTSPTPQKIEIEPNGSKSTWKINKSTNFPEVILLRHLQSITEKSNENQVSLSVGHFNAPQEAYVRLHSQQSSLLGRDGFSRIPSGYLHGVNAIEL